MKHRVIFCAVALLALLRAVPSHAAPFAYISCQDGTYVIDTATDTVVTIVPTDYSSGAVAVTPGGAHVYISHLAVGGQTVTVDTSTHAIDEIPVSGFLALHPTGSLLYVAPYSPPVLSVVSTATGAVIDTVSGFDYPLSIAAHPAGGKLYVADVVAAEVKVIGTGTNSIIKTIDSGMAPTFVAINPSGSRAYVANLVNASVSVIDTATDLIVDTVSTGNGPRGIAIHPDGATMYVCNSFDDSLSVVDTATDLVVTTVPVGDEPASVDVHPDGSKVYVVNNATDDVSVIDTATNTVLYQIPIGQLPTADGRFIAGAQSSMAATAVVGTGTLTITALSANGATLDFNPGPFSVFGTAVDIDAALSGMPMNASALITAGTPAGFDFSFSATNTVLPAFALSGSGQAVLSGGRILLTGLPTYPSPAAPP